MAASSTEKHSVAVSVRIRPDGYSAEPCPGGIACGTVAFGFPANVLEGSDQSKASSALVSGLVRKFVRGGTSCTLMAYGQTGSGKTYTMFVRRLVSIGRLPALCLLVACSPRIRSRLGRWCCPRFVGACRG